MLKGAAKKFLANKKENKGLNDLMQESLNKTVKEIKSRVYQLNREDPLLIELFKKMC